MESEQDWTTTGIIVPQLETGRRKMLYKLNGLKKDYVHFPKSLYNQIQSYNGLQLRRVSQEIIFISSLTFCDSRAETERDKR